VDCGNPGTVRNGRVKFSSTVFKSRSTYSCDEPYYRLNGNSTYECSTDAEWVDVTGGDPTVPKCKPVCGRSGLSSEHGRIFGGRRANPGYFPWQVRLHTADGVRGAGALISDGWVLTAAHLFDGSRQASMWAGAVSLADAAADPPVQLEGAVLHPGYRKQRADRREYNFDHDIALVRLRRKVRLGPLLSPVCLPGGRAPETGRLGFIAGWGKTETRQLAVHLQYARVPVARMDKCEGLDYRGRVPTFTANMICAGQIPASSSRNADSCQGDSGGAYVFTDARDPARHVVRGIVSFGPPQCGSFGVYTNVGNYIDWIQKTVEEWEDSESGEVED
ncbi:complement C1s subcomponent-like, partial [Heptranchias perlo]|uniref:complement C1s subcomponent-like n=1 Tax=Heptranchias perlo TaxID=212740 RepID=UPI003559AC63